MKIALSRSVDGEDARALAQRCQSVGAAGVEINGPLPSVDEVRNVLAEAGLHIASIVSAARFTQDAAHDVEAALQIRSCLEWARHAGCHLVSIPDPLPGRRESLMATISALADWLTPLALTAADQGSIIVIENGRTLATARALWLLMERVDHVGAGVCWNVDHSLKMGERPAVVVPTLNSRIRYVRMATENAAAMSWLQRIGYSGWIARENKVSTDEMSPSTKG